MSAEIWWRLTKPVSRPVPASGPRADPDRNRARVLSAIALASVAAGAINVAAAATVGRGSTQNLAFFSVVAAAQLVWGVVSMAEAPRWWLALGAAGNLVVVATWVVSRTVGLPRATTPASRCPVDAPSAGAAARRTGQRAAAAARPGRRSASSYRVPRFTTAISWRPGDRGRPARSAGRPRRRPGSAACGRAVRTHRRSSCRWPRRPPAAAGRQWRRSRSGGR